MLTHLDLFSGIGGFSLAAEWAGFKTIGFIENDSYCQKVLKKHWPDVPIVEDIRDVKGIKEVVTYSNTASQSSSPINEGKRCGQLVQSRGEQGKESSVTLITGGFPCQSFSVAGKRRGKEDDRYLWPEMLAIIKAVRPTWVLAENVTGIIPMALDTVLLDLANTGYSAETVDIPACAVNAKHRRDRIWILGYATSNGLSSTKTREGFDKGNNRITQGQNEVCQPKGTSCLWGQDVAFPQSRESWEQTKSEGWEDISRRSEEDATNSQREGLERTDTERNSCRTRCSTEHEQRGWQGDWWAVEPELGRVAHGISHRVDRLRCLGNAIVPQVAYEILKGIAGIEGVGKW